MMRALFVVMLLAGTATAGDKDQTPIDKESTMIFPLGGTPPRSLKDAPAELTRRLARLYKADVATVPIQDAAELIECELPKRSCLEAIAKSFNVERIVFGQLERKRGNTTIELTLFDDRRGAKQEQFVVEGATTAAVVEDLDRQLDRPEAEPGDTAKEPEVRPRTQPASPSTEVSAHGHITAGTWGLVIAGGATLAIGGGVYISAVKLSTQAQGLPTDTREQIDRLRAVERAGKTRAAVGGAMMAVGGIVTTIGIVRAMVQRSSTPERPLIDVVPEAGGASVLFTKEWK